MKTKEDVQEWDKELHKLAKGFGESDKSAWLMEYGDLKQKILDGCSLDRYANVLHMSDSIIKNFSGYEYLAILFARSGTLG